MHWHPITDRFKFKVCLNLYPKRRKVKLGPFLTREQLRIVKLSALTKRSLLLQISGTYNPLGILVPFTMRAKVMMQYLWKNETKSIGWDDPLPEQVAAEWILFFQDMFIVEEISFKRCIRPKGAIGDSMLIIFSDASDLAYGACAYL